MLQNVPVRAVVLLLGVVIVPDVSLLLVGQLVYVPSHASAQVYVGLPSRPVHQSV